MRLRWVPLTMALAGCSTMGGMRTEPLDAGATRRYSADLQTAVVATRNALIGSALDIDDVEPVDDQTWMFLAKRNTSRWSHGELIRVIVQQTGAEVVVVSRTRADLEQLGEEIRAAGGRAVPVVCDVTDADQVRETFDALERVDVVVNSAGMNIPSHSWKCRRKTWTRC